MLMSASKIGLIGLAVMGSNLARNIARNGYAISVYNRTTAVTEDFMRDHGTEGEFSSHADLKDFVASLERPRSVIIMVKAGAGTDAVINQLLDLLEPGDLIVDGGNALHTDTERREKFCKEKGIFFMGVGISGGEEGALWGPSMMPGGDREAWERLAPLLSKIVAQNPEPCTDYIGPGGSGHFVKTVHNGIEYGDMQLIAEVYDLLSRVGGLTPTELHSVFHAWNEGVLNSFLIEITATIFEKRDPLSPDDFLVDKVLDRAGQKGTGRWTVHHALDLGVAIPTIAAAVDARTLSSKKSERIEASKRFEPQEITGEEMGQSTLIEVLHDALFVAKILSYAQGMDLLRSASVEYDWNLNLSSIAKLWRGGCIIRARFLDTIAAAYEKDPGLSNLIMDKDLSNVVQGGVKNLRRALALAVTRGVATPALAASLSYFDSCCTESLPQNLTQAQRDYFGAHTFERVDRDGVFHEEWGE